MPRVLILTASYGSGHTAPARSLSDACERAGTTVAVVDHFRELVHPVFDRLSRTLYHGLLRRAPFLWGAGYSLGDWLASESRLTFGVTRLGTGRLAALLERLAPDVVVTVHATPASAMSTLAPQATPAAPPTPGAHAARHSAAAAEVRHEYIARGIPEERIVVTGVPVREEFGRPADGAAARATLGLSLEVPVVLAVAGAPRARGPLRGA